MTWIVYAAISAVAGALTAFFAKIGVDDLRRDLPRRDHDVAAHGWRRADDRAGALITLEWQ